MKIAIDKKLHLIIGFLITLILGLIFNSIIGLCASILIGAGKEVIWDYFLKRGHPEFADFIYTLIGGLFGFIIFLF